MYKRQAGVYIKSMEMSNRDSPLNLTLVNQMKTTIICLKGFTTRDPNTGRTYKFVPTEVVKGKKREYVKTVHIDRGIFAEVGNDKDCSIQRREIGRRMWHEAQGTDPTMDLEYQAHICMLDYFGNDALRAKGSGQTKIMDALLVAIRTTFATRYVEEMIDGNDDILATREGQRGVLWANDRRVVLDCIAFAHDFLTRYEA